MIRIRDWLYIGNRQSCHRTEAKSCIHIYRSDKPEHNCRFVFHANDMRLDYIDGHHIDRETLAGIHIFAENSISAGCPLLVHCSAGLTRGPTIGFFVLSVIEMRHPFDCLSDIYFPIYKGGRFANITRDPFMDIVNYYENNITTA